MFEQARDAHFFARRAGADAALPVQPLRRVGKAVACVRFLTIELGDEREEAVRRGVQVAPELGDLGFELLEALGSALFRSEIGVLSHRISRAFSCFNIQYYGRKLYCSQL